MTNKFWMKPRQTAVNKFWPHYPHNSEPPLYHVEIRHDRSIPGCTPAPREGIYRPIDSGQAWKENHVRADKYCTAIQGWMDGNDFGTTDIGQRWQAMWRASGHTDPIYGAYGERL